MMVLLQKTVQLMHVCDCKVLCLALDQMCRVIPLHMFFSRLVQCSRRLCDTIARVLF